MTHEHHQIVAFHFNADHASLGTSYGYRVSREVFRILTNIGFPSFISYVLVGDLQLHRAAAVIRHDKVWNPYGKEAAYCNIESVAYPYGKRVGVLGTLLSESSSGWSTLHKLEPISFLNMNIYVLCFRTMPSAAALALSDELESLPYFLGAVEVNETSFIHKYLYLRGLVAAYRFRDKRVYEISDFESALMAKGVDIDRFDVTAFLRSAPGLDSHVKAPFDTTTERDVTGQFVVEEKVL